MTNNTVNPASLLNYHTAKYELEQLLGQKIGYYVEDKIKVTVRFLADEGYNCTFKFKNGLALKVHSDYIYGDELLITVKNKKNEYVLFGDRMMMTHREEIISFVESFKSTTGSSSKTCNVKMNTVPAFLIPFIDGVSCSSAQYLSTRVYA